MARRRRRTTTGPSPHGGGQFDRLRSRNGDPALHNMYDTYSGLIWGRYGFKDAFNLEQFWVGNDYLGIDQGPIIIMIENYLNGSVWNGSCRIRTSRPGWPRPVSTACRRHRTERARLSVSAGAEHPQPVPRLDVPQLTGWDAGTGDPAAVRPAGPLRENHRRSDSRRGATDHTGLAGLPSGVYVYSLESQGQKD